VAKYVLTDRSQTLGDPRIVSAIAPPPVGVDVSADCAVPRGRGTYFQNALRPDRDPSAPSSESSSMFGAGAVRRPKKEYSTPRLPAEMTAEELAARPFIRRGLAGDAPGSGSRSNVFDRMARRDGSRPFSVVTASGDIMPFGKFVFWGGLFLFDLSICGFSGRVSVSSSGPTTFHWYSSSKRDYR